MWHNQEGGKQQAVMSQWESWTLLHSGESVGQSSVGDSRLVTPGGRENARLLPHVTPGYKPQGFRRSHVCWSSLKCCLCGMELGATWVPNTWGPEMWEVMDAHHIWLFRGQTQHTGAHRAMWIISKTWCLVETGRKIKNEIWSPKAFLEAGSWLKSQYIFCKGMYIATDVSQTPQSTGGNGWRDRGWRRKKITKTYPVTRQATHTFPPKDKYLPPFGGLCEGGRRGRIGHKSLLLQRKHTLLCSQVPHMLCLTQSVVTLVSLSLEGTEFGSLFHCGRYLVLYSIPTSLFPWEMDPNWSRQSGCGIPLEIWLVC